MPLSKAGSTAVAPTTTATNASGGTISAAIAAAQAAPARAAAKKSAGGMSKDEYWDRKELRDIERDKHMAWSGLAQAALTSGVVAQFNIDNTEDGLVAAVVRITEKILAKRP